MLLFWPIFNIGVSGGQGNGKRDDKGGEDGGWDNVTWDLHSCNASRTIKYISSTNRENYKKVKKAKQKGHIEKEAARMPTRPVLWLKNCFVSFCCCRSSTDPNWVCCSAHCLSRANASSKSGPSAETVVGTPTPFLDLPTQMALSLWTGNFSVKLKLWYIINSIQFFNSVHYYSIFSAPENA